MGRAATRLYLWDFAADQFAAWCALVGPRNATRTHGEYLVLFAAAEEAALERGADVQRISPSVQQVRSELRRRNLPNTPQGRAAAIAHLGATGAVSS